MPATGREATIVRLYQQGLSTRAIAARLGLPRVRVSAALHGAAIPIAPRGRGRGRPGARLPRPDNLAATLRELYVDQRLTRAQVAAALGVPEHRVRAWLSECGIDARSRGATNREDRPRLEPAQLQSLYTDQQLPAREVGQRLSTGQNRVLTGLHEQGVPVRAGGNAAADSGIALLDALYADPQVREALTRHDVPPVRRPGPLPQRFPRPAPLTKDLLSDLYLDCGLSSVHIELLTGQPATTVRKAMVRAGIPARPAGGRSPFLRRLRPSGKRSQGLWC